MYNTDTGMSLINSLLDIIFPPRDSALIVRELTAADLSYHLAPTSYLQYTFLLPYQHPDVRACITEAKFHHNRKAQQLLGYVLHQYITETYGQDYVCVPIPLSRQRMRERGHNQVSSILTAGTIIQRPLLARITHTTAQSSLTKTERLRNVDNVFALCPSVKPLPTTVLVVDDVITTGATMNAAIATISTGHEMVIGLALAH